MCPMSRLLFLAFDTFCTHQIAARTAHTAREGACSIEILASRRIPHVHYSSKYQQSTTRSVFNLITKTSFDESIAHQAREIIADENTILAVYCLPGIAFRSALLLAFDPFSTYQIAAYQVHIKNKWRPLRTYMYRRACFLRSMRFAR